MTDEISMEQMMNNMPRAFRPEAAQGVDAVLQFHFTGAEPGDWYTSIKDGTCTVAQGNAENPRMTVTADSQDYKDVILGKTNAMQAFMMGKLKLAGDLNMAMKLPTMFKMG